MVVGREGLGTWGIDELVFRAALACGKRLLHRRWWTLSLSLKGCRMASLLMSADAGWEAKYEKILVLAVRSVPLSFLNDTR